MYNLNKTSETSEVRERLWNWMIKANGEEKWISMRNEIVEIIRKEAAKVRAQKGYVTYDDLPDWVRLRAIDLMYYPEDVKRIIHEI